MKFTGLYPKQWNGYVFLQWSWGQRGYHEGVDYNYLYGKSDLGLPVVACSDGVVEWVGYHNGFGNHVFIKHITAKHGVVYSHYAHLQTKSITVKKGDQVKTGQQIAKCGATGHVNMSPHLHFDIRKPIGLGYDFYPSVAKGWFKARVQKYYFDAYDFIEKQGNV